MQDSNARLQAFFKVQAGAAGIIIHFADMENYVEVGVRQADTSGGSYVYARAVIEGEPQLLGERHGVFVPSNRLLVLDAQYSNGQDGMFVRLQYRSLFRIFVPS